MIENQNFREALPNAQVISQLREMSEQLAHLARTFILTRKPPRVQVLETKSSATDVVTQMDKDVEDLLRAEIRKLRPTDGFLGEESECSTSESGLTWVIDPIDGTVNYLYGLPHHSVSIAIVWGEPEPEKWVALAGAVIDIDSGTLWSAAHEQGAYRGDVRLRINAPAQLEQCLVGTGFGYSSQRRLRQAQLLVEVLPQVRDIRRLGSAAVDLCLLAQGSLDLYYEVGLNPWDMAAGALIAKEAGALVQGLDGLPAGRNLTLAGAPDRVREFSRILKKNRGLLKL